MLGTTITDLDVNSLSGTTVSAGSDGFYAVNLMQSGGNPVVMLVNARNPAQITFTTLQVPTLLQDSQIVGNILYTTSDSGLASYDIGALVGTSVSAQVRIPKGTLKPGSFNIAPDQTSSDASFEVLTWQRVLSTNQTSQTITWDSLVNGLQPGEFREIVNGGTVDFVANAVPGHIPLPPLAIASEQILALTPASQTAQLGSPAAYTLTLKNPTATAVTYNLSVQGVPSSWVNLASAVTVPAQGAVNQPLTLQSDTQATPGENGFVVTATSGAGARGFVSGALTLQGTPSGGGGGGVDLGQDVTSSAHGIVVSVTPQQPVAGQGTPATFRVRLTNTGNVTERFTLSASLGTFGQQTVEIPPGLDNYREVLLTVTLPPGTAAGTQTITITAVSATQASVRRRSHVSR